MSLTVRQLSHLGYMQETGEELVADGLSCWIGFERVHARTVNAFLRCLAVKDVSDSPTGLRRLVVSDTGQSILRRPQLADEVELAVRLGKPFQIVNDRVYQIGPMQ